MINVVTSCSAKGWEKYGSRFVTSFHQHWPASVKLHLVSEDPLPVSGVEFWSLYKHDNWLKFFGRSERWMSGAGDSPRPEGIGRNWRDKTGYNFRFDAYKFSKKVFAIELVSQVVKTGRLLWIDADTLTFDPVPEELPVNVLPNGYALSCLQRPGYHSECGFVGYNLDESATHLFIKDFSGLYHTGEVFKLAEWHDSWVFDWLRNKKQTKTYAIPHKSSGHPFINSELGRYMDHMKGKRKDRGRSLPSEQHSNKKVPYWQ